MLSFNFSPLAALVLGILIGFLIEWLLELLYFRRQRRGAEERLAQAESDLQERNRNLLTLRTQADTARSDLATAQARVTSLQAELRACQAAAQEARGQATTLQTQLHGFTATLHRRSQLVIDQASKRQGGFHRSRIGFDEQAVNQRY